MSFFNGGFGNNAGNGFGAGAGNAPTRFGVVGAGVTQPPSFGTSQSRPGAGWGSNGGFRTATAVPSPPAFGSFLPPTSTASAAANTPVPKGMTQTQRPQSGANTQPTTNFAWGSRAPVAQPPRGAWPAPQHAVPPPTPRTPAFTPAPGFPPAGGWLHSGGVQPPPACAPAVAANPVNNVHNLFVHLTQQPQPLQQTAPAPAPAWHLPAQPTAPPPPWLPAQKPAPQPVNNPFVWPSPPSTPQLQQQQQPAPPTPQTTPWAIPPVRIVPPSPVTPPPQPQQQQQQQQATPQTTAASWPYGAPQLVAVGTQPAAAVPIVNPASFAVSVPTVVAAVPAVPATPPRPTAVHSARGARAVQAVRLPPRKPVPHRVANAVPSAATAVEAFEPRTNPRSLFIRDAPPSPERRAALAAAPSAFAAAVQSPPQATAIAAEVLQPAERAAAALSQAVSLTTLVQTQAPSVPLPTLSNPAYYCKPSLAELGAAEAAAPGSLQAVHGFELGCHHVGAVRFLAPVDLTGGADLSALVVFRGRAVGVYPPQEEPSAAAPLPPPGRGLNVPADVTLLRIFPRKSGADEARRFRQRLQQAPGTRFVSYDEQEGTWRFQVTHF